VRTSTRLYSTTLERKGMTAVANFSPNMQDGVAPGADFLPLLFADRPLCECSLILQLDGFQTLCIRPMHCTLRMDASGRIRDLCTYRTTFAFRRLEQRCRFSIMHAGYSGERERGPSSRRECRRGAEPVQSAGPYIHGSNVLAVARRGSVIVVIRRRMSTGRKLRPVLQPE
jgi:hypothetical protein